MQTEKVLVIGEANGRLAEVLEGEGYRVKLVKTGYEALEEIGKREPFGLLILPFEERTGCGPGLVRAVRELRPYIPVVFTDMDPRVEEVLALMKDGPVDFLGKHWQSILINSVVRRSILAGRSDLPTSEERPSILVVEDDESIRWAMGTVLEEAGFSCRVVSCPSDALRIIQKEHFHIIITDLHLPEMEGTELVKEMTQYLPEAKAIIITGSPSVESAVEAVKHSVLDYIVKPLKAEEVVQRIRSAWQKYKQAALIKELLQGLQTANAELEKANKRLSTLSITDGLTSLYNHRFIMECLSSEYKRILRYKHPLSVLLLDIDNFKRINDTYGHATGDGVLVGLAKILREQTRQADIVGRYGGEEFWIILPDTSLAGAKELAGRLVEEVARHNFVVSSGVLNTTISVGVASTSDIGVISPETMLEHADKALYVAKKRGKNQACCWEELQADAPIQSQV